MSASYSIVPGSIRHVKPIAATMRSALCASIFAAGEHPRTALRRAFMASSYSRTALLDGRPAAMWGMMGALLSDRCTAWLALTDQAIGSPLLVVREAMRELQIMCGASTELGTNIARDDKRADAFARSLGFRPSHVGQAPSGMVPMTLKPRWDRPKAQLRKERVNGPAFIIHALGRSRTAWLSEFLTYGGWDCLHEQAMYLRHPSELREFFARPRTGYAETAASFGWPLIQHACPDVVQIVVNRDPADAGEAMAAQYRRLGLPFDEGKMADVFARGARVLRKISALPGTLTLSYEDLATEDGCRTIFEACLPYEWDRQWWLDMSERHVEADVGAIVSYYQANRGGIEEFKRLCRGEMMHIVRSGGNA